MGGTRDDELSSGMAILGLLIERPDTASGVERRLAEQFAADGFVHSTGHSALRRLRARGYVGRGPSTGDETGRFAVTPEGVQAFKRWLGTASAAPLIREDLRGKIAFLTPADIPRIVEIIRGEERTCAQQYEAAHAAIEEIERTTGVSQRPLLEAAAWRARMKLLLLRDEATVWLTRRQRLERMRAYLEDVFDEARRARRRHPSQTDG